VRLLNQLSLLTLMFIVRSREISFDLTRIGIQVIMGSLLVVGMA
jgi:hypothetical protein